MDVKLLEHTFTYHPPEGNQIDKYDLLRNELFKYALLVNKLCPDSREKLLAFTKLEEAIMWANASIARNK